jgi:16S rRNA (guanine527-N7)-methyltransferase
MTSPVDSDGFGPRDVQAMTGLADATLDCIGQVLDHLRAANAAMNLVSGGDLRRLWRRHVFDSVELVPHLPAGASVVDLGSGSGFPALPVGCWQACEGGGDITMVESIGKKARFLSETAEAVRLRFHVKRERAETMSSAGLAANVVTARAVAPLTVLLGYALPLLASQGYCLFHKGARYAEELEDARRAWSFTHEVLPNRSGADGVILRVSEISPIGRATDDHPEASHFRHRQPERRGGKDHNIHQSRNGTRRRRP